MACGSSSTRTARLTEQSFKTAFSKNYDLASRRFQTAIDEIDKAQDVTIKKLTRGNATMAAKFAELKDGAPGDQAA